MTPSDLSAEARRHAKRLADFVLPDDLGEIMAAQKFASAHLDTFAAALDERDRLRAAINDHLRECEDCRVYDPASGTYGRRGRECERCKLLRAALRPGGEGTA